VFVIRRVTRSVLWVVVVSVSTLAANAASPTVRSAYLGSFDVTSLTSWAWGEGRPAQNYRIEQVIRRSVEKRLADKGLQLVSAEADCFVRTRVVTQRGLPIGVLIVELLAAESEAVVWRGEASGMTDHRLKKLEKIVAKAIKKMFRDFPKVD
jgi:hypothetical protein